jgi:hypothetical protein
MGLTPHRAEKLASERKRSGLSPAARRSCAAPVWPIELRATMSKAPQFLPLSACRPVNALAGIPLGLLHPSGNRPLWRTSSRSCVVSNWFKFISVIVLIALRATTASQLRQIVELRHRVRGVHNSPACRSRDALACLGARPMEMRGRTMEGYVYIDPPVPTTEAIARVRVLVQNIPLDER